MNDKTDEPIGLTCLHKDGEIENFEGEAVTKALSDGWIPAREASANAAALKDAEDNPDLDTVDENVPSTEEITEYSSEGSQDEKMNEESGDCGDSDDQEESDS